MRSAPKLPGEPGSVQALPGSAPKAAGFMRRASHSSLPESSNSRCTTLKVVPEAEIASSFGLRRPS
jgi:hypothetical protein